MSRTILLVGKESVFRFQLKISLQEAGFIVNTAQDEQEVLALLPRVAIDLLLVDSNLLAVNGPILCSSLRTSCKVPIIVMASSKSPEDMLAAYVAGADDYVTKPFSFSEVMVCIQKQLQTARFQVRSTYALYKDHGEPRAQKNTRSNCGR